jgi:two-component system chemotaxis sensor kinase CheA
MDISQFLQKFIDEAGNLLTNLDNVLIELEKDPGNKQYINEAFRVMHTIKGASGMYGFEKIVEITHELESLYDIMRGNSLNVPPTLLEITFSVSDHIRALLVDKECADFKNMQRHSVLKENIDAVKKSFNIPITERKCIETKVSAKGPDNSTATWNIFFYPDDELIRRAVNLVYTFQDLFHLGEYKINNSPFQSNGQQYWSIFLVSDKPYEEIESALMFILDYCKINKIADFNIFDPSGFEKRDKIINNPVSVPEAIYNSTASENVSDNLHLSTAPVTISDTPAPVFKKQKTTHINVDALKLDTLMYLVSELVTTKSELLIALQKQDIEKATDTAGKIEKLSKLFNEIALNIRLVSLHEMLNRFKRLIHDLSKQLNKSVNYVTIGEETELDKNIIDNIGEPIMHLIRNCIDHGIESPEKRIERGKPETGTIKLEAVKSGNYVCISISDDGNGIDTAAIYNKAVEKGFIAPGTELTEKETLNLIFLPGFSTAQSLSNVSGRGVGMDIVLKKIQEIRGEISITSNVSIGTTFTIKLQQTITIIETLLIEAAGITYAIPVEDIGSCMLEASENIFDKQNNLIGHNGSLIPFMDIRSKFSSIGQANPTETEKLVIIERPDKVYAIVVDNILGEYQAVIKPIGNAFADLKFLSGASLLGDGSIALLLDTDKLWYEINVN